jgi:hypothetical protein
VQRFPYATRLTIKWRNGHSPRSSDIKLNTCGNIKGPFKEMQILCFIDKKKLAYAFEVVNTNMHPSIHPSDNGTDGVPDGLAVAAADRMRS